jgi:polyhydroxybutyrate depolymerase
MTLPARLALLGSLSLVIPAGCSRSTLDAVTRMPGTGGSTPDSRDAPDISPDAAPEAGPEPGPEAGPEPGPEAGPEPGPEAGPEARGDTATSIDIGSDTVTCPSSVLAQGETNQSVKVGTMTRTYVLHVPSTYKGNRPVPLVVDFHGLGTSGGFESANSLYPTQTDKDGAIMAFPDGAKGKIFTGWNVGPCCVEGVDDVAFAKALVEQIRGMACIDEDRVYAVGFSMGGGMAYYLACHAADVFAAIAPSGFDLLQENVDGCVPLRPITVISFRGTNDKIVPITGGYSNVVQDMPVNFLGAELTFKKWAELDRCIDSESAEDSNGCKRHSDCQDGVEVILCTKPGGGNDQGNASIAWPVLKQHPR